MGLKDFKLESDEVLYPLGSEVDINSQTVAELIERAKKNPRRRIRICAHSNPAASLHEMIIVSPGGIYVRPHRHPGKTESYHVIEGTISITLFDSRGEIKKIFELSAADREKSLFVRLDDSHFHMIEILSEFAVYHETTQGPFDRNATEFASWAPVEKDTALNAFLKKVQQQKSSLSK